MDPDQFPEFRPLPLLRSAHAQTVLGAYLRSPAAVYTAVRRTVKLDDGDYIVLHDDAPRSGLSLPDGAWTSGPDSGAGSNPDSSPDRGEWPSWHARRRVVLMLHGLGGSFRSGYMPRVAARLNARGWRTFRMDMRGWGAGRNLARRAGHAGLSSDVAAALQAVARFCPGSPISLIGFSLGGNLALKLVGESGERLPKGLDSVLSISPPIDLLRCAENIKTGLNWIYDRVFIKSLHRNLRERQALLPPLIRHPLPKRLYEFDDLITAPLSGFESADHYYQEASSGPLLRRVRVPTLILTAEDDPIIPVDMFARCRLSASVKLHVTRHGGHLGFIGRPGQDPDHRWLDWRIVQWVEQCDRAARELVNRSGTPLEWNPRTPRPSGAVLGTSG